MREQGRCSGCQQAGPLKKIGAHVITCAAWAALYREDPAAALAPAEEYERWRAQDRAAEHQADLARRVSDTQANRAASVALFQVRDSLED
jgi:hypothetical protein